MNRKKMPVFVLMIALVLIFATGCGKDEAVESWAYNFDETKEILRLNTDGSAMFMEKYYVDGIQKSREKNYTSYKKDDNCITLTGSDGDLEMRYESSDKGMVLYEKSTYTYTPTETYTRGDGIVGVWTNVGTDRYYFEFSVEGHFMEDGLFVGDYFLEGDGKVRLDYYDDVPDSVLYYSIQGDEMTIEYPWDMVPTKKD